MCARMCVRHALFLPACCSTRTLDRPANALLGSNNLYGAVPAAVAALLPATGPSWSATCVTNASAPLSYCGMPELTPLLDLYVATGGGDWLANVNWLVAGSSPCTWSGIACGTTSGPVMCVWGSGCSLFPADAVVMWVARLSIQPLGVAMLGHAVARWVKCCLERLSLVHVRVAVVVGRRRGVSLDSVGLVGTLPSSISGLTSLQYVPDRVMIVASSSTGLWL